jgi:hypothetical protein
MAVASASVGSFLPALAEPSNRDPRRQRRRHLDDLLTRLSELLGQQLAQPLSRLDRPATRLLPDADQDLTFAFVAAD